MILAVALTHRKPSDGSSVKKSAIYDHWARHDQRHSGKLERIRPLTEEYSIRPENELRMLASGEVAVWY